MDAGWKKWSRKPTMRRFSAWRSPGDGDEVDRRVLEGGVDVAPRVAAAADEPDAQPALVLEAVGDPPVLPRLGHAHPSAGPTPPATIVVIVCPLYLCTWRPASWAGGGGAQNSAGRTGSGATIGACASWWGRTSGTTWRTWWSLSCSAAATRWSWSSRTAGPTSRGAWPSASRPAKPTRGALLLDRHRDRSCSPAPALGYPCPCVWTL